MATVLVTGADGFIGSHLTEALVRSGHDVRAFVMYNSFDKRGWLDHVDEEITRHLDIVAGDVRDANAVRNAVHGCDAVYHLAALIGIPYSYVAPDAYIDTNVKGTLNVVQAARDFDVEKVVHTSTSEVYGTAHFVPMPETHPLQGQSPYSASKIAADQIAWSFQRSFGTPVAIARPFNTYGPRQSTRAVIPTVITQIAAGFERIKLGATSPTRDFTFVEDTVRGFMAVAASSRSVGEAINLGSGFEISVQDTAVMIADIMGADVDIALDAERLRPTSSEVERLYADASKAAELLGWTPDHGGKDGLRNGLTKTIAWFQQPENLAMYRPGTYAR